MRKQLKLLFLLIAIIGGLSTFVSPQLFSASATYVEGHITQDTIWTLTDSPFVLSKDVTVDTGVTLTIMAGVEVRFGGNFSFTIMGRLVANGAQDNWIMFTSNKQQPKAGDWNAIQFINGTQQSTLDYSLIEYAINGTTIQNSNVKIMNSKIRNNSQNGINAESGTVEVTNSEISSNVANGVTIKDGNVKIQDNEIRSNGNGIFFTGNLTSPVDISRNKVLLNNQSGIRIDVFAYSSLSILYNTLSSNEKGFYVSGQANTQITNNSIAYNKMGIFYESQSATAHIARFNDIYGNDYGMDVSLNALVSAIRNYWGDESGPYHMSLNPTGKGNKAGGDGSNLDFIPWLTAPIGYINQRPTARLLTDKALILPGENVAFIATNSSDDRGVDQYFFNFGDGTTPTGWITLSVFEHKYTSIGNYSASVTVMDDFGVTNVNTVIVVITVKAGLTPHVASLTLGRSNISSEGQVSITVHAEAGASIRLFLDRSGGSFTPSSGFTDSTGYFIATFIASYVPQKTYLRITATASKNGYTDGSDYKYILVLPLLVVEVTANPVTIKSEAVANVTVHVTHNLNPISNASVTLALSPGGFGSFKPAIQTTDLNGNAKFTFTAPQVTTQLNVTITATATKSNYFDGESPGIKITINPKTLVAQVTASPTTVEAKAESNVKVHVTSDGAPVWNATVSLSSATGGNFSVITGTTDANGNFTSVFVAPETTTQVNVTITASVTKSGYVNGQDQTEITVNPPSPEPSGTFGLPLTTLLLIVIPIVVVAIVAVLIKAKVIVITREQEE